MHRKLIILISLALAGTLSTSAQQYTLASPDGRLVLTVQAGPRLGFTLTETGRTLIPWAGIGMTVGQKVEPGENVKVRKVVRTSTDEDIIPPVRIKDSVIRDHYNQMVLECRGGYELVCRAYDNAVAYRFILHYPDTVNVTDERFDLKIPDGSNFYFQGAGRWMNPYEHLITYKPMDSLSNEQTNQLPMLIDEKPEGAKLLLTESDLYDYPGLYFTSNQDDTLRSIFPPAVKTLRSRIKGEEGWDREIVPGSDWDYIARTSGDRAFPWRIMAVADQDGELLTNQIVYKLGEPDTLKETSWIEPGKVAWDWWNDWNITGVDFRAGVNTETYKYYIDFAARHGLPYILIDDGWYVLGDLTKTVPAIDMKEIIRYATLKNVGVLLWCSWWTLNNQMEEALDLFKNWQIKGIKVDFMDRDDQYVVDFYWRLAAAAAKRHLVVDFHGAHKPSGIFRTYPNILNFEGVPGLEQDKWTNTLTTPEMAVTLPFTRMFAGPMDYTPGAMRNAQLKDFAPIRSNPMSLGTRCQQLAMYVLFDAPLQMLADNPQAYEREPDCLNFIASVPTTWDSTIVLAASVGEYLAEARKNGQDWFLGAMTNWTPRDLSLDLSFLPPGTHQIVLFQDGINADRNGTDYKMITRTVTSTDKLTIHLAPGGGWAARINL